MCFKKFSKLTKQFLALFMALIVLLSFTGCGSGKAKVKEYHVGILSGISYLAAAIDGFKEEMTKRGYIDS